MFTIEQIQTAHARVKSGADFPKFIQDIAQMGVINYETFVNDGHTIFKGNDKGTQTSAAKYAPLVIASISDPAQFQRDLKEHQQGKTNYSDFCEISAKLGVEKWIVDIKKLTCTYYDISGNSILTEIIPMP